jgi:hypothetical protein
MSGLSEEELAVIEAIADAEDNGDTGLDRAARAVLPRWTDDRYMQLLVHLQESGFVDVKTKGHPRIVQVKIVGTTYNGRSALNAARPTRVNVARVLSLDERKDIDVFVRLLAAALGEAEQNRPGPLETATAGAIAELRADLDTLTAQLASPRPKRSIVRSVLIAIGTVTSSVVGVASTRLASELAV